KVVAIGGPTCTGKSDLAVAAARHLGGEIVNGDSMQVYRYFDIGTAKPSAAARESVPHHLIDMVDPDEEFNAAFFQDEADRAISDINGRGRVPIIVGGTGLYLRALFYGLFPAAKDGALRERLTAEYAGDPIAFYERLKAIDPVYALRISFRDRVRAVRAMEIYLLGGKPVSELEKDHGFREARYDICSIGLAAPREELYRRIDERVLDMLSRGLVDEVRSILARGYARESKPFSSIGYREVLRYLSGSIEYEDMVKDIQKNTRNYAKRQFTWFRKEKGMQWFEHPQELDRIIGTMSGCVDRWN
ncbi:MAG: tRNA (adenosine(37)-N6)-dimethylallyltransferase MiaA, partial [Syntrophorhabdaceae bacterium]|nr:tRNA (adenosine(37)-N6)-dimethylallyltransferase MiaA [Syntrophorhabdaceae bacterium]